LRHPHQIPTSKTNPWRKNNRDSGHFDRTDLTLPLLEVVLDEFPLDLRPNWPKGIPVPSKAPNIAIWKLPSKRGRRMAYLARAGTEAFAVLHFAAHETAKRLSKLPLTAAEFEGRHGIPGKLAWKKDTAQAIPAIIHHHRGIVISLRTLQAHRAYFKLLFPGLIGQARERYLTDVVHTFLWSRGRLPRPALAIGLFNHLDK